jgi:hypothetical protein
MYLNLCIKNGVCKYMSTSNQYLTKCTYKNTIWINLLKFIYFYVCVIIFDNIYIKCKLLFRFHLGFKILT